MTNESVFKTIRLLKKLEGEPKNLRTNSNQFDDLLKNTTTNIPENPGFETGSQAAQSAINIKNSANNETNYPTIEFSELKDLLLGVGDVPQDPKFKSGLQQERLISEKKATGQSDFASFVSPKGAFGNCVKDLVKNGSISDRSRSQFCNGLKEFRDFAERKKSEMER